MAIHRHYEGEVVSLDTLPSFMKEQIEKYTKSGKLTCLGYYRQGKDISFFLPRSIKTGHQEDADTDVIEEEYKDAAILLYGSINRYRERIKTGIVKEEEGSVISTNLDENTNDTLLDHILALQNFYHRNKNLVLMIYKEAHRGYNRINWAKTVRHSVPIISYNTNRNQVAYMDVCNERSHIHDQEELMVLFFSTLDYIQQVYNIPMPRNEYYTLIGKYEFEDMVGNQTICPHLKAIRQQYFNDRMQELWKLLYAFHNKLDEENESDVSNADHNTEFLLATDFDRVFEDMVDYLISDTHLSNLKRHEDNRIIDHIFLGKSLFGDNSQVYYIADSKYYKPENEIDSTSIAKQYDYARNIIQMVRDRVNLGKYQNSIGIDVAESYYNRRTHGYNVIPNFFIRPRNESSDSFVFEHEKTECVFQHKGCLFDRSTLFLLHYGINLKYLLQAYVNDDEEERRRIKERIEGRVYDDLSSYIKDYYSLTVNPRVNVPDIAYSSPGILFEIEGKLFMALPKSK
jgi:hypothetical protein